MRKGKILVVEPDEKTRAILSLYLEKTAYEFRIVDSSNDAVRCAKHYLPNLAILTNSQFLAANQESRLDRRNQQLAQFFNNLGAAVVVISPSSDDKSLNTNGVFVWDSGLIAACTPQGLNDTKITLLLNNGFKEWLRWQISNEPRAKLLIVEPDDELRRDLFSRLEARTDYQIIETASEEDAVLICKEMDVEVVLTGENIALNFWNIYYHQGLDSIVVCAIVEDIKRYGSFKVPFDAYLEKPISTDDLILKIEKCFGYQLKSKVDRLFFEWKKGQSL